MFVERKILIGTFIFIFSFSFSQITQAQDRDFGIGGVIGDPDGITVKGWLSESTAISGVISFNLGDDFSWFLIQADYLKQKTVTTWEEAYVQYHYGGGIRFIEGDFSDSISLRGPIGLDVNAIDIPVEVFMEIAPTLDVDPDVRFYFSGAVGFRYYFWND